MKLPGLDLVLILVAVLMPLAGLGEAPALDNSATGRSVDFCSALQALRAGDRLPVVLSGIYSVGNEHQVFYDPMNPLCDGNLQPATWVEFSPQAGAHQELDQILRKSRRAYVVLQGALFGPRPLGPDDLTLPLNLAYANRIAGRRYGHHGAFRTQFLVTSVLDARAVPKSTPWAAVWHRPETASRLLAVDEAAMPRYPPRAHRVGLEGDVIVEVVVQNGGVTKTTVLSGDRLLADAAVENIKTWRFNAELEARVNTTFSYRIVPPGDSHTLLSILAELPKRVTLTVPRDDW